MFSSLGHSTNLSAFPSLKSSSIDNMYDIPIGLPIETTSDELSRDKNILFENQSTYLESLSQYQQLTDVPLSTLATCERMDVVLVSAIGNDGNVPSNVLDNNLNTRWSNLGTGSWIQLDLGSKKSICSVDIAWYLGNARQNNFVISVSDNGNIFTNKFTGTSSGSTTSPEKYMLPTGTEGRYVRITVNGNTENEWASINEIAVFGSRESTGGTPGPIYHKAQTAAGSDTWTAWGWLGGSVRGDNNPVVDKNSDGRLAAFIVNDNNAVYYKRQSAAGSDTWTGWAYLGGTVKAGSEIAVTKDSSGRLAVFIVNNDNAVYYKRQSGAGSDTWTGWVYLGGSVKSKQ